jgi:inositol-phosphate transport system ATP-binding protein
MARITLDQLSRTFGTVRAVDAIDLEISDGEFVAILGPSGCGKSTSLFMLAGIETPTSGRVLFDGVDVTGSEPMARGIGLVFQSYALYPHMSVLENIAFPLEMLKRPKAERLARAKATADIVQIGELLDRRPHQLSGGQQQRVALARALVKQPRLLLLDEPLSNLDASLRQTMRSEIRRLQRELGLTTVLVTHDQIEATTMADRIVVMNRGRIAQIGRADDLYRRPADLFVAGFIGSPAINLVPELAPGGTFDIGRTSVRVASPSGGPLVWGLRPEHLRFATDGLPGTIDLIEPMGREVQYTVSTPMGPLRVLESQPLVQHREGTPVAMAISASDILAFDQGSRRALPVFADTPDPAIPFHTAAQTAV